MYENLGKIPIGQCIKGRVYKINCRNLSCGVYNGDGGFIGIREKFGDEFLFTEYHWDQGPPFGTVSGQEDTGIDLPPDVEVRESLGTYDTLSGRPLVWDNAAINPHYPDGGRGWWKFADSNETAIKCRACSRSNVALFKFLSGLEKIPNGKTD
jgi:hypothetical protein